MISGPHYSQRAFNADAESTAQGLWTLSWEVFLYRNISAGQYQKKIQYQKALV